MKQTGAHLIAILFCVFSLQLYAQTDSTLHHFVGLGLDLGYALQFNQKTDPFVTSPIGGVGVGLDAVYQLQYRHLLFQTGLEYKYLNSKERVQDFTYNRPMTAPYPTMTYHYNYTQYAETQHLMRLSIPLRLGAQFGKAYFLAGVTGDYNLWGQYKSNAHLAVTATDEQMIGNMGGMPNHLLNETEVQSKAPLHYQLSLGVTAEGGIDLTSYFQPKPKRGVPMRRNKKKTFAECLHYYLGLKAEYGVLNINNYNRNKATDLLAFADVEPQIASSVLGVSPSAAAHPFFVGVTFRVLYEIQPKPKKPVKVAKPKPAPKPKPKPVVKPMPAPVETVTEEPVIEQGVELVLENVYFATNQTTILAGSEPALDELAGYLLEHPETRILITGYTDNVGSAAFNQRLSEGRATAVGQELVKRGVSAERITTEGKGMNDPRDTNDTEEGRQKNRRVEFLILNE